jgi:predicted Na+-dependent transporter
MRCLVLPLLILTANICSTCLGDVNLSEEAQVSARFSPGEIRLMMGNTTRVNYTLAVDKKALASNPHSLKVDFRLVTLSPQLDIVEFDSRSSKGRNDTTNSIYSISIDSGQLKRENYVYNSSFHLKATYIGHAIIKLESKLLKDDGQEESLNIATATNGQITIIRNEGILDRIFMYSVIVFITISYINLGAQIDIDNVRRLVATPKIIFFGFLIGIVVMPSCSWLAGHLLFQDQPMYRVGSFIYACAPAASASVLWTVMFDADKELALGLQISSTVGALITMPIFLYAMDKSIDLEGQYTIKVPYLNLARTLVVLLIALLIGSRLVGRNKRARQISQMIFRPLTMFVLLFIIIFSSIVYWYVYKMFNLHITLMAFLVTCATYTLSGLLGYLIKRDVDHMITISISSTYRNSGIAFAALVVAFQPPDIFIAYVPCLTQVVTTSLIGLVLYAVKSLRKK